MPSNVYNNDNSTHPITVNNNIKIDSVAGANKVIDFIQQNPNFPAANFVFSN